MSKELRAIRPVRRSPDRRLTGRRQPRLEALERRELMAVDFTSARGLTLGVNPALALPSVSVALGNDGATYLAGTFTGTQNFNPGGTGGSVTSKGGNDIFVAKYNTDGSFAWVKTYGDAGYDAATGVAVDNNGSVFVVGEFTGTVNFGTTLSTGTENRFDGFVLKLDASNGTFGYATQFAGPSTNANGAENLPTTVAADASGNAYVGGRFEKTSTFGNGPTLTANGQSYDGFVAKLGSSGGVTWVKQLLPSTTSNAWVKGIAVDASGNVVTTGQFNGQTSFDPNNLNVILTTPSTYPDAFVWKLNSDGAYLWARQAGGNDFDVGEGVAVDSTGNIYATGKYTSPADSSGQYAVAVNFGSPTAYLYTRHPLSSDVFVWKLDAAGNVGWARGINITNDANEPGRGAIVVQPTTGNVLVGGSFINALPGDNRGNDIFVAEINPTGRFIGLVSGGGTGSISISGQTLLNNNVVQGMAVNSAGTIAVAGVNSLGTANYGGTNVVGDAFVAKLQANNVNRQVPGDFDGDGKTDTVVYDVYTSRFYISMSSLGNQAFQFGPGQYDGARPTPIIADYDGDGTADLTVFNRKTSTFYIARSKSGNIAYQFGPGTNDGANPFPIPADYSGDGKADPAVFNSSTATFYVAGWNGTTPAGKFARQFGPANSIPVVADYDGDGKADPADFDQASSTFYMSRSRDGNIAYQFGPGGSIPIPADYSGDGKADPAVFQPSTGDFYIAGWNGTTPVGRYIKQFGSRASDGYDVVPVMGDFDGDGKADIASFQRNQAIFYISRSSKGAAGNSAIQFGQGLDYGGAPIPLPITRHLLLTRKWV